MRKHFRARATEAPILEHQINLLWAASRAYGTDEAAEWENAASITKDIAVIAAQQSEYDRKVIKYVAAVLVISFIGSLLWLFSPPSRFMLSPLFRGSGWLDIVVGHVLQLTGFTLLFVVIIVLERIEKLMRYSPTLRMFADGASYVAPFVAIMPSVAIYCSWMRMPRSPAMAALYDGLLIGGVVAIPIIVVLSVSNITKLLRAQGQMWDNPRLAFLHEALLAIDKILPPLPRSPAPLHRVVERILDENKQWWNGKAELIIKLKQFSAPEPIADREVEKLASTRWFLLRGQIAGRESSNPLFSALAKFMWSFHPMNIPKDAWGHPAFMGSVASHMRSAARCVQVFGQRQRTGEAVQDNWQRRVCEERAAFLRALQRGALLPRNDTRAFLVSEFKRMFALVVQHDWGSMPLIELPDVPRLSWWQKTFRVAKTVVIAVLPLAALYSLSNQLKELQATLSGTLWTGAVVWLAVSLLTLLDERFSEKLSGVKEVLSVLTPGKGKE
jgi:hypothetical protein